MQGLNPVRRIPQNYAVLLAGGSAAFAQPGGKPNAKDADFPAGMVDCRQEGGNSMSFSEEIKSELARKLPEETHCLRAELAAIIH